MKPGSLDLDSVPDSVSGSDYRVCSVADLLHPLSHNCQLTIEPVKQRKETNH